MATFRYKAVSAAGKTVRGTVEADTERQAVVLVREKGCVPLRVEAIASVENKKNIHISGTSVIASKKKDLSDRRFWNNLWNRLHPVPKTAVAAMARQLATLLQAGLPLDEALGSICAHDDVSRMQSIVSHLRDTIMEGGDLAEGLAAFPHVFSSTFVTMVRAGEASGTLELVVERFAEHIEQQVTLLRKVQSTLAYPLLMLIVGIGVVVFLLTFVIPKVTQIFSDMGKALPLPTQILLAVSDGLRSWWWLFLLLVVAAFLGLWRMRRTPGGRKMGDRLLLRLPGIRSLYQPLIVGQMTRTLGMLLKNGVTLVKALTIVQSVADNRLMAEAIQHMVEGVQSGKDLSDFMTDSLVFPALSRQMVAAGERSGQLGEMLLWVAGDCENRVASRLQMVTSLMEPLMILVLGGIVGFVVIAIILPIFEMSSLMG